MALPPATSTTARHSTNRAFGTWPGGGGLCQTLAMARSRDGVEIAYEVHGDGVELPAVVLVHGWAGNRTYWDNQVDYLAHRRQVVTIDLGGHGESGLGRGDWNLPAFGNDVVAVVDEIDLSKMAFVGHSMGGDAVLFAARQLGDRVAGLVWVDVVRSLGDEPVSSSEEVPSSRRSSTTSKQQPRNSLATCFRRRPTPHSWLVSPTIWLPRRATPPWAHSGTHSTENRRCSKRSVSSRRRSLR